jgi:tetratricopeptide (TPR) repeat protein
VLLIDPEDPENRVRYNQLGLVELVRGKSEDAIEWFEKATAGDPDPVAPDESLSRREWNEIGLIAAYSTTGRLQQARARYEKYVRLWPHRTVWRLASYFTKAESVQPGLKAALDGLKAAGMPEFADERLDEGVAASPMPRTAGDFELTANAVPGARTVTTSALIKLTHGDPSPIILDVGCGAGVPDGASWIVATFPSDEGRKLLRSEIARSAGESASRPIVVMGSSVYDWNAYNATLAVISLGYRNVSWYRGGEEAWAAAGLKAHDRRDP